MKVLFGKSIIFCSCQSTTVKMTHLVYKQKPVTHQIFEIIELNV